VSASAEAVRWFRDRRGISEDTLAAFGVRSEPDEDDLTIIPYPGGLLKYRKGFEKEDGRRFWWTDEAGNRQTPGQVPLLPPGFEDTADQLIVFEGETDTWAAWQAASDAWKTRVVGISGTDAWAALEKSGWVEKLFGSARRVFFVTDNESQYDNPDAFESVERGWKKARASLGRKARRVQLPPQFKDANEFFQEYDWAAFHVLLKKAGEPRRIYPRLNLNQVVPATDWIIEDLFVASEATALVADGGVGKSMIMMAAALCVADPECEMFLNLPIHKHGPVLYVDEENSRSLAIQRFHALGYDPNKHSALEYLWMPGVDLLNEPEKLLEDAQELEPALVVVDSLSRVALGIKSENDNAEMSRLMKAGVIPIARQTNAGVVIVHHTSATGTGPRGATAIRNAADQVISIIAAEDKQHIKTGKLNIFPSKPRRQTAHLSAVIKGDMEHDGWLRVERPDDEEDPF
jgi:hypothetical protein